MKHLAPLLAVAVTAWLVPAFTARAQCPDPADRVLTFPDDRASNVPVNATLFVEFPSTQAPGGRPTWLVLDSRGNAVEGSEDWDGLTTSFNPTSDLEPRRPYYARVSVAATGQYRNFEFNTGSGRDERAPSFSGLSGLSWEHRTEDWLFESCRISREGIIHHLEFSEASDDSGREHLCYHIYQTSGGGISSPTLVARTPYIDGGFNLLLPPEQGEGHVCFRVEVRDLSGRFDGNSREHCVDAIVGAVFEDACRVGGAAPRDHAGLSWASLALVCLAIAWRRLRPTR